ncbi:MAG: glycosyltransferase domain-containing protein [Bacteroidota bacterium]
MKKIAIYTVIVDDYDSLKEPLHVQIREEADFYCFTNNPITSDFYTIVPIQKMFSDAALTNRYYKILSHPCLNNYEYTIYLDGSLQVITNTFRKLIYQILGNNDLSVFKHQGRSCVYEEAKAIIYRRRAAYKSVYNHVKRYRQEKYPENVGLIEATAIIRNNQSSRVKEFVQMWWDEFYNNAHRDQLSFNYIHWKYPLRLTFVSGTVADNEFFKKHYRPTKLPSKSLHEKLVSRYWAIKVDLLNGKFKFGSYVE